MKKFIRLLRVEFKRIFSNNVLLAIFFGAPILYGVLFGYVYQQAKVVDLPIVIVDQDNTPTTDKIIDAFGDNEVLLVKDLRFTPGNILEEMPVEQYAAVVTFPSNFEADILQKRHPEVRVDLNMANILNANTASNNIQAVLMTMNAGIEIEGLKKQGMHPNEAMGAYESFKINFNKLYNSAGNYVTFMLPGLLAAIMQQVIFLALALVFARDFEDGYFGSLVKESKSALYHIVLKATPFLLMLPVMWIIVSLFIPYFKIDAAIYNFPMMVLATLLTLASMFIGMLFSIAIPNQLKATELLMVISTPAFVLSGFTWPTLAIPDAITSVAQYIPLTQFLNGFRKIAFYGGDLSSIQTEISMLLLIILVTFLAMLALLQFKIFSTRKKLKEDYPKPEDSLIEEETTERSLDKTYSPDVLGEGIEQMTLPFEDDYEGSVVATLVRKKPQTPATKAILYIHGFNDYFFQRQMAQQFNNQGYNFYALDLRKYGRSLLSHQKLNNVRSLLEYDAEINEALQVIKSEGNTAVILMGHSTGGLIVTHYAGRHLNSDLFHGVIGNSPFYEFNLGFLERKVGIPILSFLSRYLPNKLISGGLSTLYGHSLHEDKQGEWDYSLVWKPHDIPKVNFGFIHAIYSAQKNIQHNLVIDVPTLVLYSNQSIDDREWSERFMEGDAVLNVAHIKHYANKIEGDVTTCEIENGMHDLVLSKEPVRETVYEKIFEWLNSHFE